MQRIFLVGCPRSGTTLVQSLLAAHPDIISFPETKIFHYGLWDKFKPKLYQRLYEFFNNEIKRPELLHGFRDKSSAENVNWFMNVLDGLAAEQAKNIWIEKTPEHIFFIHEIEHFVPDAKFIHVLRNGLDAIASMYEATRMPKNELWGGAWSLNYCIYRWKDSTKITQIYANHPNHLIVRYEDVLLDKVGVIKECCEFIGVDYDENILNDYKLEGLKLGMGMPWHEDIDREIKAPLIPKYQMIFHEHVVDYILRELGAQ